MVDFWHNSSWFSELFEYRANIRRKVCAFGVWVREADREGVVVSTVEDSLIYHPLFGLDECFRKPLGLVELENVGVNFAGRR